MEVYREYARVVAETVARGDLAGFKSNPSYRVVLEHVQPDYAIASLQHTLTEFGEILNPTTLETFLQANDALGNPEKHAIGPYIASPSSFRYVYHAHLALATMAANNMKNADIVEIGGGYGGLCLAISHFASAFDIRIHTYHLVDLADVVELQKQYLAKHMPLTNIECIQTYDADNFGKDVDSQGRPLFLISNYAYAELTATLRNEYKESLFPKVQHGFVIWNSGDACDITRMGVTYENERPTTPFNNKFVRF